MRNGIVDIIFANRKSEDEDTTSGIDPSRTKRLILSKFAAWLTTEFIPGSTKMLRNRQSLRWP